MSGRAPEVTPDGIHAPGFVAHVKHTTTTESRVLDHSVRTLRAQVPVSSSPGAVWLGVHVESVSTDGGPFAPPCLVFDFAARDGYDRESFRELARDVEGAFARVGDAIGSAARRVPPTPPLDVPKPRTVLDG